jgi:eukaryotic-like serine/threonine-protein kinase
VIKDLRASDPESVGTYRLLGRLGAGRLGQVYLARSPAGGLVAIKVVRPELAEEPGFRARFAGEAAVARNVTGTFTAAVVGADADAELPWIATEYVPGPSLADTVESSGPLPAGSLTTLAFGLAEALREIHRAGLVHRDLKPSNVLVAADGPRVTDFAVSRALERSAAGPVAGSPGFLSPEQARGLGEVGPASDVFSLGAVLAYAATGNGPFGAGPTVALLYRVVNEDADLTGVPAGIRPLVERCLAKDPAARPAPADLIAALGGEAGRPAGSWPPGNLGEIIGRDYVRAARALAGPPEVPAASPSVSPSVAATSSPAVAPPAAAFPDGTVTGPARRRRKSWPPALTASVAAAIVVVAVVATLAALSPTPGKSVHQTIASVSGATRVSCQDHGSLRSSDGGRGVAYSFANKSAADIQIWFVNAAGAGVLKGTVGPGGSFGRSASVGQYWMVTNPGGGCLSIFRISGGGGVTVS